MEDELMRELDSTVDQQRRSDEPSFEAFREAEEAYKGEVQHGRHGTARLTSAELVEQDDVPEEYTNTYTGLADKYVLFDAELAGANRTVTVVCPARDRGINLQTALDWAEVSSIAELAGQRVPIRHVENDVYRVEVFTRKSGGPDLQDIPIEGIKLLSEYDLVNFEGGEWSLHWLVPTLFTTGFFGAVCTVLFLSALFTPVIMLIGFFALLGGIGAYQKAFRR